MTLTYTEAQNLIAQSLEQQEKIKDKFKEVGPEIFNQKTLESEQLAVDYSYCFTKNLVAIRKLEYAQIRLILEKMNQNEEELKKGIENLENVIEERVALVERILDSLDQPDPSIDEQRAQEAEDRIKAYDADKLGGIPADNVFQKYQKP